MKKSCFLSFLLVLLMLVTVLLPTNILAEGEVPEETIVNEPVEELVVETPAAEEETEVAGTANDEPVVLRGTEAAEQTTIYGVWYFHQIINENMEVHVTTDSDAQYLILYQNGNEVKRYNAADEDITDLGAKKEWNVWYTVDFVGNALLSYRTSVDGTTLSAEYTQEVYIDWPPMIPDESWYDAEKDSATGYYKAFVGNPLTMHITTSKDVSEIRLQDGDDWKVWQKTDADVTLDEYATSTGWTIKHTFEYPGDYNLYFRATDSNGLSNFYTFPTVSVSYSPIIDVWYYPNPGIVNKDLQVNVITRNDIQYIYLHIGDNELAYSAADVNPVVAGESKTWTVIPEDDQLNYAGTMNLWYEASVDGVERSAGFNKAIVVGEEPIIYMYKDVESATVGEPITLHFATNAWMENIYMYLGEDEIAHWTEENAEQVTASETYKEWTVTHTFEEPGTMNVWFKAANADGEMSNAYNFDPIEVVPAESATIFELDDVEYALIEGGASIHAYKGSSAVVTIPETVMYEDASYTVIEVGESAFEGNTTLTSIDLPDTIQVIRRRAFANCTALANMN